MKVVVERGELHRIEADALLRPIRADGEAITTVGRRLEAAAGPGMSERLLALGEMPVGAAFITPGGDLAADFVIHVVLQAPDQAVSEAVVLQALRNGFRRARDWDLRRLALPLLGTGAGNLPVEESLAALQIVLDEWSEVPGAPPTEVVVVVDTDYEEELCRGRFEPDRAPDATSGPPAV